MSQKTRIAVLGANGFIGKHIVHYLQKAGYSFITCYDVAPTSPLPNYQYIDLTNKKSVNAMNFDVDYVFLLAGLTGTYAGFDAYEDFVSVNEIALLHVLDAIKQSSSRPKIIFPSTRLVYKGIDKALREEDPKETKTIYAANKLACEGYLQAYRDSFDIPFTIFRICIPYGNLLSSDYSFGTVGFFIKQAKAGKNITLYGGGTMKRTFTHMEDLCYQMTEGAFQPKSDGQIYNIGGETLSLHDAAEIIAKKYGTSVVAIPWPERDLRIESNHTYFDDSKIQSLLKLKPYKKLADFTNDL